jgi:hypothetical protein
MFAAALLALTWASPISAQADDDENCAADPRWDGVELTERVLKQSPNPDGVVEIKVGLFVNELREINAVSDSYRFLGTITASWCDPRLAFNPVAAGKDFKSFHGSDALRETDRIWTVQGFPANQIGAVTATQRVLRQRYDGMVSGVINLDMRLATDYDLRRFPFDRQTLMLDVESFAWNSDQVVLVADRETSGFADNFQMPEWRITGVHADTTTIEVARAEDLFSRFTLAIDIERKSGFYIWKVLLPLLIIVALSWSVFWMRDEKFAVRVRTSATGILTIVAYQFMAAKDLPRVAYLTLIDKIMVASFVLLAITVIESLFVSRLADQEFAARVDRTARWVFPLAYGLIILLVLITSSAH